MRVSFAVRRGFTMIELLTVLAILAVLILISIISYSAYLQRSRDNLRKNHLEKYRVALEEYNSDLRTYPPEDFFLHCGEDDLQPYLPEIYCDPITKQPYRYVRAPDGTGYTLYTTLEITDDPVIAERHCDTGCGPDDDGDGAGDYNYGLTEKQAATGGGEDAVAPANCNGPSGPYCPPNVCRACCPGVGWRCNAFGTGCDKDVRCN